MQTNDEFHLEVCILRMVDMSSALSLVILGKQKNIIGLSTLLADRTENGDRLNQVTFNYILFLLSRSFRHDSLFLIYSIGTRLIT